MTHERSNLRSPWTEGKVGTFTLELGTMELWSLTLCPPGSWLLLVVFGQWSVAVWVCQ